MLIARVIGETVATRKHPSHEGLKLLIVQPLNLDGSDRGDAVIAVDAVDAGVGDRVLLTLEGFCAMSSVDRWPQNPIESAVIGVVDEVELLPEAVS
jgi:ethanolamine utilization protein EutN